MRSKRLVPKILVLLPALERHGQLAADEGLRAKLLAISPATIDRLLSKTRIAAAQGRRRRAGFSSAVRRSAPVRIFADWGDPPPGFVEVDFVAHSGVSAADAFEVQTWSLNRIATVCDCGVTGRCSMRAWATLRSLEALTRRRASSLPDQAPRHRGAFDFDHHRAVRS